MIACEGWLWEGVVGWMEFSVWNALAQSVGRRERLTEAAYASVCAAPTLFDNAFLSWGGMDVKLGKVRAEGGKRGCTHLCFTLGGMLPGH